MHRKLALALGLAVCTLVPAATAQQPYPLRVPGESGPMPGEISVAVNYSLAIPLKSEDEKSQAEALETSPRTSAKSSSRPSPPPAASNA